MFRARDAERARCGYLWRQAEALYRQGYERGDNDCAAKPAIEVCTARLLADYPRTQRSASIWATTQNESRHCAPGARRAGKRGDSASRRRSPPIRAALEVADPRAGSASSGRMTQTNLGHALASARRAGERARSGSRRLWRPIARRWRMQTRERRSARLGNDAEQSRRCALRCWASGRAGRRGSRRRWRPTARRWRSETRERVPARLGDDAERISAMRSEVLGERESGTARLERGGDGLSCRA